MAINDYISFCSIFNYFLPRGFLHTINVRVKRQSFYFPTDCLLPLRLCSFHKFFSTCSCCLCMFFSYENLKLLNIFSSPLVLGFWEEIRFSSCLILVISICFYSFFRISKNLSWYLLSQAILVDCAFMCTHSAVVLALLSIKEIKFCNMLVGRPTY